ncbi:MAG: SRPBCC family protein [Alphaproteobacteria bacterium]|nr:SRPBCC family protein [Alphaproteobacteria bacterium]
MQKHKKLQMKKTSSSINISADKLWDLLKDYHTVGTWIRNIDHSTGSGDTNFEGNPFAERTCHIAAAGYDIVKEKLNIFDPEKRQFGYIAFESLPGFVLHASNIWTVSEAGPNKSKLEMNISLKVKPLMGAILGGFMLKSFSKNIDEAFEDLTIFAETGNVSPAKAKANRKFEKTTKKKAA